MSPHIKTLEAVMKDLTTSREGLGAGEARKRLDVYGRNELVEKKKKAPWRMFLDQFTDFMIIVLIAAAIIAGVVGKPTDAIAILTIVVLNAIIGFIQEYRAEEAMAALKRMAAPSATVIRDGQPVTVPAGELVPGDVVLLEAGQVIPADMRLCECANLRVEEAALTGESEPVEKRLIDLDDADLPLGDRRNMAYQGTVATYGRGAGIVTATGMATEMGKIAALLQSGEEVKTPLHQRLTVFGKRLALAILVICAIVFFAGCLRGEPMLFMLLTAISLAVAAIPEALPAVITIALALGAKKMVKLQALIRKLPAVETLGSVTYICSDKTGTLTQNRMTVETLYTNGTLIDMTSETAEPRRGQGCMAPHLSLLFTALAISNDARCNDTGETLGDPTEVALHCIAEACGYKKIDVEARHPRTGEIPFDSDRKSMTTIHALQDPEASSLPTLTGQGPAYRSVSFTKGALDALLEKTDLMMSAAGPVPVDRHELQAAHSRMAAEGLRVLAVAARFWEETPGDPSPETVESHLILLGLVGMMDPPRTEAMEAVAQCKNAGIVPVMITGDHALTATTIARRLGILDGDSDAVITGRELEKLSLEEFEQRVEHIRVYARVAPEQKLMIVQALQDRKQFVAMTGDGVNDAPALKRADIGVAMGITGTDVTKEASSMILLDDNFATIVKAVREGRRIYDNILKFIKYSMTSNAGTLWAIFLAPFFGLPLPLLPIQILWINLLTDSLPGLALTAEPVERDAMNRPPRKPDEGVFAAGRGWFIIRMGLVIGVTTLLFQFWAVKADLPWQTMIFTALVIGRMAVVMGVRSEKHLLFQTGFLTNRPLLGAVALTLALQLAAVYWPFFQGIFSTEPLTLEEFIMTLALSSVVLIVIEGEKAVRQAFRKAGANR